MSDAVLGRGLLRTVDGGVVLKVVIAIGGFAGVDGTLMVS